jgi:opacity protein-like surface antigen
MLAHDPLLLSSVRDHARGLFSREMTIMMKAHWLLVGIACSSVVLSADAEAQGANDGEDLTRDVLRAILGPDWNLFVHGGLTTNGRFVLQRPAATPLRERALSGGDGFNIGVGVGVDILPRVGWRGSYTYSESDLEFRSDDGDGSSTLDLDDVGFLQTHFATLEIVRYVLPTQASITPYGSAGLVAAWWMLDGDETSLVETVGGSTQFRFGALATFGVQFRMSESWNARIEYASASVRNPFTGGESFRALGGVTIDEPTRVNKSDIRLVGVYHFGKAETAPSTIVRRKR